MMNVKPKKLSRYLLAEQESGGEGNSNYEQPQPRLTGIPDASDSLREKNASVDQKIDSYLFSFERDATAQGLAKKSAAATATIANDERPDLNTMQQVFESLSSVGKGRKAGNNKMSSFLFVSEQQQPDPAADAGGAADPAGGGGDPFGGGGAPDLGGGDDPFADLGDDGGDDSSGGDASGGETVPVPKINVRKFAEGVARLAINYDTLLDPQSVILNRAMYYISKNYSPRLAKELVSILEQDFKLTAKSNVKGRDSVYAMPFAGGAGPESGGVPSGGGSVGGSSSGGAAGSI
jgi:hypothetical protein